MLRGAEAAEIETKASWEDLGGGIALSSRLEGLGSSQATPTGSVTEPSRNWMWWIFDAKIWHLVR